MKKIKLGIQTHSVREDFAADPAATLLKIAEIGYSGIETTYGALQLTKYPVDYHVEALKAANLECFSIMIGENDLKDEKLNEVIEVCKKLSCGTLVIGSVNLKPLAEDFDYRFKLIEMIKSAADKIRAAGLRAGFHNHDIDHLTTVDGKKEFLDFLFENITEDFMMMIDTGNTQGGGADPIEYIKKYPNRTQICHFKGYSPELKYTTPIWLSAIDGDELIDTLVSYGDAEILSVEFGARSVYIPMNRAKHSYNWLAEKLTKKGLM